MQILTSHDGNKGRIKLEGRFDFSTHRDFRAACDEMLGVVGVREIEVDLGSVSYLDSSALGMLLLLRDKAESGARNVALANSQGSVRQVLEIANFGKLFELR